jgi:hypothetical protein
MKTSRRLGVLAFATLGAAFLAGKAMAADYATIVLEVPVNKSADQVWKKVGGFCDIGAALKKSCTYTSGTGGVGTVRRLDDRFEEIMVGNSPTSYTYSQATTTILYHGTLGVEAKGPKHSKLVYTLFYDQEPLGTPEAKAADREKRSTRFTEILNSMKEQAEAK